MVKGITRQVIVVQSPDKKLFEQAIFIVKENAADVTDDMLLKEARKAVRHPMGDRKLRYYGPVWACAGAMVTGLAWLITSII